MRSSFCGGEIPPEILETFGTTEERREMSRIDEQHVASSITGRRHPPKTIHFGITCGREWMRPIRIHGLTCQHVYFCTVRHDFVVRQVRMEIQGRDVFKKSEFIEIAERR